MSVAVREQAEEAQRRFWREFSDRLNPDNKQDDPYLDNPSGWMTEKLGESPWSRQREIAHRVVTDRRVAVPSCFESGKSWLSGNLAAWWIDVHPPGQAFVVTTATTTKQVKAILWKEIRRAHAKGRLKGRLNQTEWWLDGEIVGLGLKPADYDPAAFQGIHARWVLVVIDEADGVPEEIFRAAAGLTANDDSRLLAIGNPGNPQSYFASICKPGSGWTVLPISAFDTPNFTGEAIPEKLGPLLIGQTYERELREEVGVEAPVYITKVLGGFPEDSKDGVILVSMVKKCQRERDYDKKGMKELLKPVEIGFDVGAGGDEAVLRVRRGIRTTKDDVKRYKTEDSNELTEHAISFINETGATSIKIDSIGIGWGIVGNLRKAKDEGRHRAEVHAVDVRRQSFNVLRFPRLRDQLWWEVGREQAYMGFFDLTDLDDTTMTQLTAPLWFPAAGGQIKIEAKEDTKRRSSIKRSPDDADAFLLAYYVPPPMLSEEQEGATVELPEDERVEISPV